MKLDRNINSTGKGKYALINLRKLDGDPRTAHGISTALLVHPAALQLGIVGQEDEFWVIKLKDKYAAVALQAYADAARADDPEYASQVDEMVKRSGSNSPYCKLPD